MLTSFMKPASPRELGKSQKQSDSDVPNRRRAEAVEEIFCLLLSELRARGTRGVDVVAPDAVRRPATEVLTPRVSRQRNLMKARSKLHLPRHTFHNLGRALLGGRRVGLGRARVMSAQTCLNSASSNAAADRKHRGE